MGLLWLWRLNSSERMGDLAWVRQEGGVGELLERNELDFHVGSFDADAELDSGGEGVEVLELLDVEDGLAVCSVVRVGGVAEVDFERHELSIGG